MWHSTAHAHIEQVLHVLYIDPVFCQAIVRIIKGTDNRGSDNQGWTIQCTVHSARYICTHHVYMFRVHMYIHVRVVVHECSVMYLKMHS